MVTYTMLEQPGRITIELLALKHSHKCFKRVLDEMCTVFCRCFVLHVSTASILINWKWCTIAIQKISQITV